MELDDDRVWRYVGTLEPTADGRGDLELCPTGPPATVDRTHWAPEIVHDGVQWRMYLTEIDGIPDRWPGHERHIVEYHSPDLRHWTRIGPVALGSAYVIDAAVAHCPDGRWRLWFKDEAIDSVTRVATSPDLSRWTTDGVAVGAPSHEGPFVFELAGTWWMITDEWRGLAVHRSGDAVHWQRQGGPDDVILDECDPARGVGLGHHGSVLVDDAAGATLVYFTHPAEGTSGTTEDDGPDTRRSVVHVVRLRVVDGVIDVDPSAATEDADR